MDSEVGTLHWLAPECFTGHYTEKADVFSLGVLFFVILERDYVGSNGKVYYGLFKSIGKVCLGFVMARYNPGNDVAFSRRAQGSIVIRQSANNTLKNGNRAQFIFCSDPCGHNFFHFLGPRGCMLLLGAWAAHIP